jgi:Meiotically up-regulated gene 113
MKRAEKTAKPSARLSNEALDTIARLAGVSRSTVSRVLMIRARSTRFDCPLSPATRRLLFDAGGAASDLEFVYFVQAERGGRIKIGTTRHLDERIRALRASSPVPLRVVGVIRGGRHMERMLHMAFAPLRNGRTEWFEPGESLLSYIRELRTVTGTATEERLS